MSYLLNEVNYIFCHQRAFIHDQFVRFNMLGQVTQPSGVIGRNGFSSECLLVNISMRNEKKNPTTITHSPAQHFVQDDTESPKVRSKAVFISGKNLWRQEYWCANSATRDMCSRVGVVEQP